MNPTSAGQTCFAHSIAGAAEFRVPLRVVRIISAAAAIQSSRSKYSRVIHKVVTHAIQLRAIGYRRKAQPCPAHRNRQARHHHCSGLRRRGTAANTTRHFSWPQPPAPSAAPHTTSARPPVFENGSPSDATNRILTVFSPAAQKEPRNHFTLSDATNAVKAWGLVAVELQAFFPVRRALCYAGPRRRKCGSSEQTRRGHDFPC